MEDEAEAGDQIGVRGGGSVAAYEAGRLFNELVWSIDQAVMLGHQGLISRVERLLTELACKLVLHFPLDAANKAKDDLLAIQHDWLARASAGSGMIL